jgi:hypothetical protein
MKVLSLLNYRSGSTIILVLLRKLVNNINFLPVLEKECLHEYYGAVSSDLISPDYIKRDNLFISTRVGYSWDIETTLSEDIKTAYEHATPYKYSYQDLLNFEKETQTHWKYLSLIRNGLNVVSSIINIKGGYEELKMLSNPHEFFVSICKGYRNQARIVIDCKAILPDYNILKFEDLIQDRVEFCCNIITGMEMIPDRDYISLKDSEDLVSLPDVHSSFESDRSFNLRMNALTEWQKETFINIAGKEMLELGYDIN